VQVIEYKDFIKKRFEESSEGRSRTNSSDLTSAPPQYTDDFTTDSVLDLKMPLHFLDGSGLKDEDSNSGEGTLVLPPPAKKSKLQILAETLEEAEMEGMMAAALQMNAEEQEEKMMDNDDVTHDESSSATNERPAFSFGCDYCSRTFRQAVMLRKHLKIHTVSITANTVPAEPQQQGDQQQQQQQQHVCPECRKSFATRPFLQAHLRSHSSVKPFKCDSCLKDFKSKHSLNEHVLLKHKGEKVFGCSVCDEQFSSKHMRAVHERLHKVRFFEMFET
jgi:uncharacterized Zn-finger protein